MQHINATPFVKTIARLGFISKGLVYLLIGILAFMAAFELGGRSNESADREGAFRFILELPAGKVLLGAVGLGLICYSFWRAVQALNVKEQNNQLKTWARRLRYIGSGLTYLSIAFLALKLLLHKQEKGASGNQQQVADVMDKGYGFALLIIIALAIAANGVYQLWYAFSKKYKKHIDSSGLNAQGSKILLKTGKLGYAARGCVWLIIAFMLAKAAFHYNASEAGSTGEAFRYLESAPYGSYLLGALGLGLACYGAFNFFRARYERFD